jgi:WD40 repeat protein
MKFKDLEIRRILIGYKEVTLGSSKIAYNSKQLFVESYRGIWMSSFSPPKSMTFTLLIGMMMLSQASFVEGEDSSKTDLYGDPLPSGAVARMGSIRFRNFGSTVTIAPDGKTMVNRTKNTLQFWDSRTGKLGREIPLDWWGIPKISPDGKWLAIPSKLGVRLLNPETGRTVRTLAPLIKTDRPTEEPLAFSSDGKLLAIRENQENIALWNTQTGELVHELTCKVALEGLESRISIGQFTLDSKVFVLVSGDSKEIYRWDVKTGEEIARLKVESPDWKAIQLSPDAQTIAITSRERGAISLWDTKTGKKRYQIKGVWIEGDNRKLAFTRDGQTLLTPAPSSKLGETIIHFWNVQTGKSRRQFTLPISVTDVYLSADDSTLLTKGGVAFATWDVATGKRLGGSEGHEDQICSLAFTPDGKQLLSGSMDGTLRSWEPGTGEPLRIIARYLDRVQAFGISPDSKTVLSGGIGELVLHEIASGKELKRFQRPLNTPLGRMELLQITSDGKSAISRSNISWWHWVHFWDLTTGKASIYREDKEYRYRIFSSDGKWSYGKGGEKSSEGRIPGILREFATDRVTRILPIPHYETMTETFSEDGRILVTISEQIPKGDLRLRTGTIHLWELASGKECQTIPIPTPGVWHGNYPILLSTDGRTLASIQSTDVLGVSTSILQVWDTVSGKELLRRTESGSVPTKLAFAPDGKRIATGHVDGTIYVWDLSSHLTKRPLIAKVDEKQIEQCWTILAGEDAKEAYQAIWKLIASPDRTIPFLREHLQPATRPNKDQVQKWIADLGDNSFTRREMAFKQLANLEEFLEPFLIDALKGELSEEQRQRVEKLLPIHFTPSSGDKLRHLRTLQILERIATPEARQMVEKLAKGAPESRVTQDAITTLERLDRRGTK